MKNLLIILLSLLSFKSMSTPVDTVKNVSKVVTTTEDKFLITLIDGMPSRDLSNLLQYLNPSIFYIIIIDGRPDVKKYVSAGSVIESIEHLLDQLPPSKIEFYRNTEFNTTIFTVKIISNEEGDLIRVVFFLDEGKVTKVMLQ